MYEMRPEQRQALVANLARMMLASTAPTQTALAKKAGVGQSTLGRILRGEVSPTLRTLTAVATALGTTPGVLLEAASGRIPLLSWLAVGVFSQGIDLNQPRVAARWLTCPTQCGPRTFALQVAGQSMEPRYLSGDIIYVDPDIAARHGHDVVVCFDESDEVMFGRMLEEEGERRYLKLKPLNPGWPVKFLLLTTDTHIAGVVVSRWSDR